MIETQELFSIHSPRDGRVLSPVSTTSLEQIPALFQKARGAHAAWAATPAAERALRLRAVHQAFLRAAPELAALLESENGKPRGEALTAELVADSDLFAYWIKNAPALLAPEKVSLSPINFPGKKAWIYREPRGVVGVISSWNYPVALPLRVIVPALLAGNAVVFKPSEWAPRIGARLARVFTELLPEGLVTLVQGGKEQGAAVAAAADFVSFTGSVAAGLSVAQKCAARAVPFALELGGKDAAIVRADADLDRAAAGVVWGSLTNAGQNCASIERVYVQESVYEAFLKKVLDRVRALKPSDLGPMTMPAQRDIVHAHVTEAVRDGAKVLCGGSIPAGPGQYYPPTVLVDVTDSMRVMREETFGPVIAIARYRDDEEAVRRANDSVYGLNASVWTRDLEKGKALALRLDAGVCLVNNHSFTGGVAQLPWGGVKLSGVGSTNGKESLLELTRPRVLLVDSSSAREMWWYPYNAALEDVASGLLALATEGASKIGAVRRLLKGFLGRWK